MKENTNSIIAYNSFILYAKMLITAICSLLTTRFALRALGVTDFGLYAVLGGIISFIAIFNTIMLSTSNRFIAVAIGKEDLKEVNTQFNVNLVVHICIALFTAIVAFPAGSWYIHNFINYDGNISNALIVFNISIAASIFSFVGVPYNGLLMAKEKFVVFSFVDILVHAGKMIVAYVLVTHFEQKLFIYTWAMALLTILPVFVFGLYCHLHYKDIVNFKFVREKRRYIEVSKFSLWVSIGAVAMIGKNQGAAMLVNGFFNTIMNTAMGIANSICVYIGLFSQNVTQPMAPQITKSYAAKNYKRTDELLLMSTKYAFLMMLLASSPFLVEPEWLLTIWLGQVPPYAVTFLILMIVDNLVLSLNAGISNVVFASGRIKLYQIITSLLNVFSVLFGFVVLYGGAPAYFLIGVYIIMSIVRVVAIQIILHKTLGYDTKTIIKNSYFPSLLVVICFLPVLVLKINIHPIIRILFTLVYLLSISFFIGLNRNERDRIIFKLHSLIKK